MTKRYPGGYITKTAPTVTTSSAPGIWTMEQQAAYQKAGTWPFGGPFNYIEDVFSTWLYTGNGSTQTITNGIDLSTYGGMVWRKQRNATYDNIVADTVRGQYSTLFTNTTAAASGSSYIGNFSTTGFDVVNSASSNPNGSTNASWTFRKQPKFFDIVTYTGNGSTSLRAITHNLGSTPGCLIIKKLSAADDWIVWHRGLTSTNYYLALNKTDAQADLGVQGFAVSDTTFSVIAGSGANTNGATYVAYLFAHNAGGFGAAGTDNVISCGSFQGIGAPTITLGYEPQWLLIKPIDYCGTAGDWLVYDNMRGMRAIGASGASRDNILFPNLSDAENSTSFDSLNITSTGFKAVGYPINGAIDGGYRNYIYIAIRRGPMKTPTDATKVFSPYTTAAATGTTVTTNFPIDFQLYKYRAGVDYFFDVDRLRGVNSTTTANSTPWLDTTATTAEATATNVSRNWGNTGFEVPGIVGGASNVFYSFQRAPGFFDEVCYTGTGAGSGSFAINHNLGVAPELIILRTRNSVSSWQAGTNFTSTNWRSMFLNYSNAGASQTNYANNDWFAAQPTATTFTVGWPYYTTGTYVAYLFASCPGVSKVGSYTGNGALTTINCGFTGGARFVLIKRTDSTGDWYVWDTARGMVSGTDPSLLLNSTAAESNANSVYTIATGFQLLASPSADVNTNGGSYIYLAIA